MWGNANAWVHKCGPRGGGQGPIWIRKTKPLKPCPSCGEEVPEELQMLFKLQVIDNPKFR